MAKKTIKPTLISNSATLPKTQSVFTQITTNFTGMVREDRMEDRDYIVVPMIMIVEGVLNGSSGPLLYPAEELAKTPGVWNHKPVVVYHPTMNGVGISACDPDIITNRKVGVIMNTTFANGKLKAEAWLEKSRIEKVDNRIMEVLDNNKMMELSTGLVTDAYPQEGEFKGTPYQAIARNYRPDHLALLPDVKGACSIEDGAGLLRLNSVEKEQMDILARVVMGRLNTQNEQSHDQLRTELNSILRGMFPNKDVWVRDVYDKYVIYDLNGHFYKQEYSQTTKNEVSLLGEAAEVVEIIEYREMNGTLTGNDEEKIMDKKEIVAKIIANGTWEESDKDFLMTLSEAQLEKLTPVENSDEPKVEEKVESKVEEKVESKVEEKVESKDVTGNAVVPQTAEEFIANAPDGIRDMLNNGMMAFNQQKAQLKQVIIANALNVFTDAELDAKPLGELKAIAKLASQKQTANAAPAEKVLFNGMEDVTTSQEVTQEPMDLPTINFEVEK